MSSLVRGKDVDWLEWRRHGIGGSDAAAIAGLSPWRSQFALWLIKTGQLRDDAEESEAMRWGTLLEPVICDEFERRNELAVVDRQTCVEDPYEPWRRVTLDGLVVSPSDRSLPLGIYEGKTTSTLRYGLDWSEGLPDHYALQVQHALSVTAQARAWVTCLVGGQRLRVFEVQRDEDVIELLLRFERTFWARVEGRLGPPPVDGSVHTTAAIREALRASTPGKAVELPAELAPTLKALVEAKSAIKVAEGWAREAQNALMVSMGDAEVAYLDGREVVTWREHEEHRLDQKALREAEPALAERYTRTSTVRTFLVKGGTA